MVFLKKDYLLKFYLLNSSFSKFIDYYKNFYISFRFSLMRVCLIGDKRDFLKLNRLKFDFIYNNYRKYTNIRCSQWGNFFNIKCEN